MMQVVQASCPKCRNVLRIPADWIGRPMRCKLCREIFLSRARQSVQIQPVAAVGPSAPTPLPPTAVSVAPMPHPVAAPSFAFDDDVDLNLATPRPLRRRGGGWKRSVLMLGCVAAVAAAVFLVARPHLADLFKSPKDNGKVAVGPTDKNPSDKGIDNGDKKNGEKKLLPTDKKNGDKKAGDKKPADKKNGDKKYTDKIASSDKKIEPPPPKDKKGPKTPRGVFPRRALLINVNNYVYANAVNYGSKRDNRYPGSSTAVLADQLNRRPMNLPATQIFELADGDDREGTREKRKLQQPTLKPVIENAIADFLDSARAQDRIILLFAGHAIDHEESKEAYLVPLEGDMSDVKTLIPLQWLYDRLAKCRAWQKVLILDVCRYPPARGLELPGSGEMGEILDGKLLKPPPGVQVWSSCLKGQQALEFEGGSVFLQALCNALQTGLPGIQKETDPLPLDKLFARTNIKMKELLEPEKMEQTSRLSGTAPAGAGPYDADEPLAEPVTFRLPGAPAGNALVNNILKEIRKIPAVRAMRRGSENLLDITYLPPFAANALEDFKSTEPSFNVLESMKEDKLEEYRAKFPVRVAVTEAIKALNDNAKFTMKESLTNPGGPITPQIKKQFLKDQEDPGIATFYLKGALDKLKAAQKDRDKETSKRWQANFDYTLARLQARLVYTMEYNFILAQVRSDSLPPVNNAIHNGWRIASRDKVQIKEAEVKDMVKSIKRTWEKIKTEYPNTPWAVMARRESMTALGLEWRPSRE
jgi:hypothetical protein